MLLAKLNAPVIMRDAQYLKKYGSEKSRLS
jgi:hypothetical protein